MQTPVNVTAVTNRDVSYMVSFPVSPVYDSDDVTDAMLELVQNNCMSSTQALSLALVRSAIKDQSYGNAVHNARKLISQALKCIDKKHYVQANVLMLQALSARNCSYYYINA